MCDWLSICLHLSCFIAVLWTVCPCFIQNRISFFLNLYNIFFSPVVALDICCFDTLQEFCCTIVTQRGYYIQVGLFRTFHQVNLSTSQLNFVSTYHIKTNTDVQSSSTLFMARAYGPSVRSRFPCSSWSSYNQI